MPLSEEQIRAGLEQLAGRGHELSAKKEQTRRRIIQSATELLLERGVRRMSMEEIAERAGVSRGTLYTYAKSKEDIVVQALAEEQLEHRQPLFEQDASPRERLTMIIADSIASFERMPLLGLLVRGDADLLRSLEHRPDVREAFAGVDDGQYLSDAIGAAFGGITGERAQRVASMLQVIGSVGPHLVEGAPAYGLTPAVLAETLAELVVEGLGKSSTREIVTKNESA